MMKEYQLNKICKVGGTFDFRVAPNPNFMLDVNLDVEFDNFIFHANIITIDSV